MARTINLDYLFTSLGITGGNVFAKTQKDFYEGITWTDGSTTYNQYQFYKKIGQTPREFFAPYGGEREFYISLIDSRIYNYKTYYEYAAGYFTFPDWILKTGFWDDLFAWIDTETWND